MVESDNFKILPRRGQYILLGKDQGHLVNTVIFQLPTDKGKGILVTTTYHGNFMIGPNAEEVDDREDVATTIEKLEEVIEVARRSIEKFNIKRALTTFSGIRAVSSTGDFIIEEGKVRGFINAAGIDSPGLTSAPAIAERIGEILKKSDLKLNNRLNFNPYRDAIIKRKDKAFNGRVDDTKPENNIICRCEKVTEAEIVCALNRDIPARTIDAIKKRTRAGMGQCQGNFCRNKVAAVIARELNISVDEVLRKSKKDLDKLSRVDIKLIKSCDK
jgi:glycerol-3-phosphate dehydrogenase